MWGLIGAAQESTSLWLTSDPPCAWGSVSSPLSERKQGFPNLGRTQVLWRAPVYVKGRGCEGPLAGCPHESLENMTRDSFCCPVAPAVESPWRSPMLPSRLTRNSLAREACLGFARGRSSGAKEHVCFCRRSLFLSLILSGKKESGRAYPTPLPAVWERCRRKNCSE